MKKHLFFPIVLCVIALALYISPVECSMVKRAIINNGTCAPAIEISVTPTESIFTYAFTETLPFGLTPLYINENGHWHPENQQIRWGNFRDHSARSFSYDLTGMNGDYLIMDSIFSADGTVQTITITSSVSIQCTQTQTENPSIPEETPLEPVASPIFLSTNQTVPTSLDISCTTQDAILFFTTDGSRPTTASQQYTGTITISKPVVIRVIAIKSGMKQSAASEMRFYTPVINSININRSVFNNESCAPSITISVTPSDKVQTYAIMEQLPVGLEPYDINENGEWHTENQTIRWGNFRDNISRSFSYSLTGVNGSSTIQQMIYSADGQSYDISKNTAVILDCPLPDDTTNENPDPEPEPEIISTPIFHTNSNSEFMQFSITCETPDTVIYYTTDGSRPTQEDLIYSTPLALTDSKTIRVLAVKDDMVSSETALFDYSITPTTPVLGEILVQVENNQTCYPKVLLTVTPDMNIQTYAVELFIPYGLNIFSISDGGILNYTQNSIRWGNFRDHEQRELSFRMNGDNQTGNINGIVGFDGHSQDILDISVEIMCEASSLMIIADNESLTLKKPVDTMLTISNAEGGYITLIATSSDQILIPDGFIQLGDSSGNTFVTALSADVPLPVSMTIFKTDRNYGDTTIVISAYDSNGLSASYSMPVNIRPLQPLQCKNDCEYSETMGMVSAGYNHFLVLKPDGTVWAWGNNSYGQLGIGQFDSGTSSPVMVKNLSNIISLKTGYSFNLALNSTGDVWAWGMNRSGQLGIGNTTTQNLPVKIDTLSNIVSIAVGESHCLALRSDGMVWAWGNNQTGQLGIKNNLSQIVPVQISAIYDIVSIEAGAYYSLALQKDGNVWAWGQNLFGQLGNGDITDQNQPSPVLKISHIISIKAGHSHSLALDKYGKLYSWGANNYGQLGNGNNLNQNENIPVRVLNMTDVQQVECGSTYNFAIKTDGSTWAWGSNLNGQLGNGIITDQKVYTPLLIQELTDILSISAQYGSYNIALKTDGSIQTWRNSSHILPAYKEAMPDSNQISSISSSEINTCAALNDGTAWCWGNIFYGFDTLSSSVPLQISGLTGVTAIGAGSYTETPYAIRDDGTVWTWGYNYFGHLGNGTYEDSNVPVQVLYLDDVISVKTGYGFVLALESDGSIWSWGINYSGQLGDNTTIDHNAPARLSGMNNVIAISAGESHSLALKSDGTVWAWGSNVWGQLGDGTRTEKHEPVKVSGLSDIIAIQSGHYFNIALKSDGTVWSWGTYSEFNTVYSLIPSCLTDLQQIVEIDVFENSCIARSSDDDIWIWGQIWNESTIYDQPFKIKKKTGVSQITAGYSCFYFHMEDGTVWMWGNNDHDQWFLPKTFGQLPDNKIFAYNVCSTISIQENLDHTIPKQITDEDVSIQIPVFFSGAEAETLTFSAYSSNPFLIRKIEPQVYYNQDTTTLTITPESNRNGNALIKLFAVDQHGYAASTEFQLYVRSVNDAPIISSIPEQTISSQIEAYTIPFWVSDIDNNDAHLNISVKSTNSNFLPDSAIGVFGSGSNRYLSILPVPGSGTTFIIVTVSDASGLSSANGFPLIIDNSDIEPPHISWIVSSSTLMNFENDVCQSTSEISENSYIVQITATLNNLSNLPITVAYTVESTATNGIDFILDNGSFIIPAFSQYAHLTLTLTDDRNDEYDETVKIIMTDFTNVFAGPETVYTLTILDNDNPPIIQFCENTYTSSENAEYINLTVCLSDISAKPVSVEYDLIVETAIPDEDFYFVNGELNFLPGRHSLFLSIPLINDHVHEPTETLSIKLLNPVNADLGMITSTQLIIYDDDIYVNQPPEISTISDQTTCKNKPFPEIYFFISDIETNPCDLTINVMSSDTFIIDNSSIITTESCENRILQMIPKANITGNTMITISVSDAQGATASTSFSASVVPNMPPVAVGETLYFDEDKHLNILLKASDTEKDPLTYTWVQLPAHGKISIENDIAIYTPNLNFNGMDRFSFKANDGFSDSNTADIVMTIYAIDDPPVAIDLMFQTTENTSFSFSFPLTDVDGELLTHTIVEPPKHGTLSQHLIYTPDDWFWETDTIVYSLTDGHTVSNTATVTITVNRADEYTLLLDYTNEVGEIEINGTTVLLPWEGKFAPDSKVALGALSTSETIFEEWKGDVDHPTDNPLIVTMNKGKSIFVRFMPPTKMVQFLGYQSLTINGETFELPIEKSFYQGDQISLKAVPENMFNKWSGDISGTQNPMDIDIQNHMTIGVLFDDSREWTASIQADAIDLSPIQTDNITIGVSLLSTTIPDVIANEFGCSMLIYSPDWDKNNTDIREYNTTEYSWIIAVNPHGNIGSPEARTTNLHWDPQQFSDIGFFKMSRGYEQTGEYVVENMRTVTELAVTGIEAVQIFNIVWSMKEPTTVHLETQQGWNLISLPVLPQDSQISVLFPEATIAYEYKDGSYYYVDELIPGKGYWLKTSSSTGYDITGEPFQSYTRTFDPGWHLIGALDSPIDDPFSEDCVEVIFRFQNGAYTLVSDLIPGNGYWIKVRNECMIKIEP